MNDNLLIAAVLREVAKCIRDAKDDIDRPHDKRTISVLAAKKMLRRAAELDPPEKNEKPNG